MKTVSNKKALLPAGLLLIVAGLLGLFYFVVSGNKPDFLQLRVFTFYSQFIESNFFTVITNNQGDELSVLAYALGWLLIIYHQSGTLKNIPGLAIFLFLAGYIFLHGMAIMGFMVAYLIILPLLLIFKLK